MRRTIRSISCAMLAALLLLGCGNNSSHRATVSMYDLRTAMEAADDKLPELISYSDEDDNAENNFGYVSDLDYDKVEHYFLTSSKEGLADEIVVIAVKDEADVDEAKKSLEEHKEKRCKTYENYMPDQTKRAEDGIVFAKDQYAVLIISDQSSAVKKAFEDEISK